MQFHFLPSAQASLTSKVAERWWSSNQRTEFVRMKGPQGKGYAEMAVSKVLGSKPGTPAHDQDGEFDFGDMVGKFSSNIPFSFLPFI